MVNTSGLYKRKLENYEEINVDTFAEIAFFCNFSVVFWHFWEKSKNDLVNVRDAMRLAIDNTVRL